MPLLIASFPNWLPIGPRPPFHGPGVSPNKTFLGKLGTSPTSYPPV